MLILTRKAHYYRRYDVENYYPRHCRKSANDNHHRRHQQKTVAQQVDTLGGKTVEFDKPDGSRVKGTMSEILPDGSILVEHDGVTENFRCGDIRIAKKSL